MEDKSKNVVHPIPGPIKTLTIGDQVFGSVYDWNLSEKDMKVARDRLGETEERIEQCLQELKKKLLSDGVNYRKDDAYLLRFLRFKKYDCQKTHENIKKFYRVRQQKPDFYAISPNLEIILNTNMFAYSPYTDEDGRIVIWCNAGRWNLDEISVEELVSSGTAMYDMIVSNPKAQINGIIVIYDMGSFSFRHVAEFGKKNRFLSLFNLVENNLPWRFIKFLVINTNQATRTGYRIIRPLLKRKLAERFILLGSDLNDLHKYVNPALLPKWLGGVLEDDECSITQQIMNNLDYLKYERFMCFGRELNP